MGMPVLITPIKGAPRSTRSVPWGSGEKKTARSVSLSSDEAETDEDGKGTLGALRLEELPSNRFDETNCHGSSGNGKEKE